MQAEWKSYHARTQYPSEFGLKCGVKVVLGVVAIGVAKREGKSQRASKVKQAVEEVLTGLLRSTKNMVELASDREIHSKQLLGLISELERDPTNSSGN